MKGGPGTAYGPRAFAAFREFQAQQTTAARHAVPTR